MNKQEYLESLSENIRLFRGAASMGLQPRVECCPGWTVGRLTVHLGEVYDFWGKILMAGAQDDEAISRIQAERQAFLEVATKPEFYGSEKALDYFDQSAEMVQRALAEADPDQPSWTWWPGNKTAGFAQRRMCHETTIHRWDCQAAHGMQTPIAPSEVAADGIDEALTNDLTGWGDEGKSFPTASFHLHCTDVSGEWLVVANGNTVDLAREHAKADVAITGEASSLLLWVWGRIPADRLTVYGDRDLLPSFRGMLEQD